MVVIGTALQNRLMDAARRALGPDAEPMVREAAPRALGVSLEQVTYAQLPQLLAEVERDAPRTAGRQVALSMAEELDRLHTDADLGVSGRLIGAVSKRMGPAAEPFLALVCSRLGVTLAEIDRTHLPQIASAVRQDAAPLLGTETALALAIAVDESRTARPPGLVQRVIDIAVEQVGPDGEALIRALCHDRLEVPLDDLDVDGIALLARAVERDGPERIGALRAASLMTAMKGAITSPAESLRAKLLDLARRQIGPAGPDFVKRACAKHGLPFDAVDFEHIMWLAETMRAEAAPLVGKKGADDLARTFRALLTGGR